MHVLDHYTINADTMILMPAYDINYESIVYEKHSCYYVRQPAFSLIDAACRMAFATYEGRVQAVKSMLPYEKKTPVLISEIEQLAVFPTHSPQNMECHWVFPQHVLQTLSRHDGQADVVFRDGLTLTVPVSKRTIDNQILRTSHMMQLYAHYQRA
ncbi:competence protein ComK [Paenalkalicoccus suaedae]|uniref:Competence protein ComK n=1 Tax=Paenalkalicoccus suaedae TaxID=2592382 RepID=A0A859FIG6_9BACI|nr:competence protein ComK [Paenalkalicoccus suaedae]QKS72640.1 competence protein ComK [Paenalkalicoccus suaedae]